MSGHSKWDTIKRKKGANDAKRAKEFTKIARLITVAAQNGGGDPNMNPSLGLAMDKARAVNMPNDNVERAIKRGTGEGEAGGHIEEISYEGYGPLGIAIIVDCATDNRNRTVADLKFTVEKSGGTFAQTGAVSWQFKTLGRILVEFETDEEKKVRENAKWNDKVDKPKLPKDQIEEFELELYDQNGIVDIKSDEFGMEIKTEYSELNNIKKFIESKGIKISDAELIKESENQLELDEEGWERVEKFIEIIEELDDIQTVWTNAK